MLSVQNTAFLQNEDVDVGFLVWIYRIHETDQMVKWFGSILIMWDIFDCLEMAHYGAENMHTFQNKRYMELGIGIISGDEICLWKIHFFL